MRYWQLFCLEKRQMRESSMPTELFSPEGGLEPEFVEGVLAGQPHSFDRLITPLLPRLKALARRGVHPQDVEDVVQQTTLKIIVNLRRLRFQSRFSTWAIAILLNEVRQFRRDQSKFGVELNEPLERTRLAELIPDPTADQQAHAIQRETTERVRKAILRLPPDMSLAVTLYHLEGVSAHEIQRRLSIAPSKLRTDLFRGRKRMARIWAEC
jgi:RNA polymerase sigma factor (sigma-70 family)